MEPFEIEAIARRVAELLRADPAAAERLIDAAEAARRLGVSRATIYARANELGAVRLGHGPKARLRFDADRIREALVEPPAAVTTARPAGSVRPRRRRRTRSDGPALLPIRGRVPE